MSQTVVPTPSTSSSESFLPGVPATTVPLSTPAPTTPLPSVTPVVVPRTAPTIIPLDSIRSAVRAAVRQELQAANGSRPRPQSDVQEGSLRSLQSSQEDAATSSSIGELTQGFVGRMHLTPWLVCSGAQHAHMYVQVYGEPQAHTGSSAGYLCLLPLHVHCALPCAAGTPVLGGMPPPSSLAAVPLLSTLSAPAAALGSQSSLLAQGARAPGALGSRSLSGWLAPCLASSTSSGSLLPAPSTPYAAASPMVLASAFPPIPGKLVEKARSRKFVDLRELLPDNMRLKERLDTIHPLKGLLPEGAMQRTRLREVKDLEACYLAILTPDSRTRDLFTYARLIMREARRAGGNGWLSYDSTFRQNAAVLPEVSWTTLDPSLHAATFLALRSGEGKHCALCGSLDHQSEDCALVPLSLQAPSPGGSDKPPGPAAPSGWSSLRICESWNRGRCSWDIL